MKQAAVVGAGTMGNGIAHVFAQYGWSVTLIDVSQQALEKARATIQANLDRQAKKGAIPSDAAPQILGRIQTSTSLDAAAAANFAVEAATENPTLKFSLFETLDRICASDVVLASNTS